MPNQATEIDEVSLGGRTLCQRNVPPLGDEFGRGHPANSTSDTTRRRSAPAALDQRLPSKTLFTRKLVLRPADLRAARRLVGVQH